MKLETIIINKEAWKFLENKNRTTQGFVSLTDEQLEKIWCRIPFKNQGASNLEYPIKKYEIRLTRDSFNLRWDNLKELLTENEFKYREDGFIQKAYSI